MGRGDNRKSRKMLNRRSQKKLKARLKKKRTGGTAAAK